MHQSKGLCESIEQAGHRQHPARPQRALHCVSALGEKRIRRSGKLYEILWRQKGQTAVIRKVRVLTWGEVSDCKTAKHSQG